jgi:hypothetical protein
MPHCRVTNPAAASKVPFEVRNFPRRPRLQQVFVTRDIRCPRHRRFQQLNAKSDIGSAATHSAEPAPGSKPRQLGIYKQRCPCSQCYRPDPSPAPAIQFRAHASDLFTILSADLQKLFTLFDLHATVLGVLLFVTENSHSGE